MNRWLLTWSSRDKGRTVAGDMTPPAIGSNVSDAENQEDAGSHALSAGGANPCRSQGMDPRGGAEFDENGPNLTEDVFWALATIWVRSEGPETVQSSGIESNTGERSDIISSWRRAAVEHALAKANDGNTDRGPILKVRDKVDQLIVRLVLRSHGRPKTIGADGWSFVTRRERF